MKEFWDQRYSEQKLAYGVSPNAFVQEYLSPREPGRILFPAEGQGRNAIYAAQLGWEVHAFDYSEVAKERALLEAEKAGVHIQYDVQDILTYEAPEAFYDAIFLCFVHLKPEWRARFYPQLIHALKPGGVIVMEAFTKTQLAYQHISGGPRDEMLLFTAEVVRSDFQKLDEVYLEEMKTILNEGEYHVGEAQIIRYVGKKRT